MFNVSSAFGRKIWQKAMFILTFANLVQAIGHTSDSVANKLYFSKLVDEHHFNILHILRNILVKDEVINEIPVLPVGVVSEPILVADRLGQSWVESYWQEAFQILRKTRPTNSDIFNFDNTYKAFTPQGNEIKSKEKNSSFSLSICIMLLLLSLSFTSILGRVFLVYGEPGKETFRILAISSTVSLGIACHFLGDPIIAIQNGDISTREQSYLSLFLSFAYYIWFILTSGLTVNVSLWEVGQKKNNRFRGYMSRLYFTISISFMLLLISN